MTISLPTGTGADYDINFQINDCVLLSNGGSAAVLTITGTGRVGEQRRRG
jgi:hypothetical protein